MKCQSEKGVWILMAVYIELFNCPLLNYFGDGTWLRFISTFTGHFCKGRII